MPWMNMTQFLSNHLDKAQHTLATNGQRKYYDDANVKTQNKTTDNVVESYKCNQCDFASLHSGNVRQHLTTHSGEK